ncbi:MAG: alpha/beta hydrolase [Candidatus Obscuribacterales bacterium]|nr:alpha/beta hydrolase [Candidatus Obscuribacterales bacterium]
MQVESSRDFKSNALTICFLVIIVVVTIAASLKVASPGDTKQTMTYVVDSNNPAQTLDLILPDAQMPGLHSKPPLIVYIHGGAWVGGDKSQNAATSLVDHGFAVASLNYRFSNEAKFPAQVDDCRAAIRFLRQNADKFHFDGNRIGLLGASAGGHLVSLLGLTEDENVPGHVAPKSPISAKVQAVCDWNGVTDFKTALKQLPADEGKNRAVSQLLGGLPEQVPEMAEKASPLTYVTKAAPPFLIIHGNADEVVPYAQSVELNDALEKAGADVKMVTVEKGTHNLFNPETLAITTRFFEDKLKP